MDSNLRNTGADRRMNVEESERVLSSVGSRRMLMRT